LPDAADCAVDRIMVHQREFARRFGGTLQMHVDSLIGKLFVEVTFPRVLLRRSFVSAPYRLDV
jgi:hypothetical protein